ncbi:MAG: PD-(D/E)XK nuclease-like domain-containing protein [Pseudomonadota bacterium]|nr:PD-(D/E)XK nuclease-like domain-containing protein [Pseudomonadota bacterium]MDP1905518.1 PD-(D/E)XK nuclease-like domain-containing protein [Pseudomonadota bacterium]
MKLEHPGLVEVPAADYHAHPALGHSALIKLLRSPAHYLHYRSEPGKDTPAKAFGTAFHAAVLEPGLFAAEYAVIDPMLLEGTLQSLDDYKAAADALGVKYGALGKDELKTAIKAAEGSAVLRFKDDVQAEMAALTQERLTGTLTTASEIKTAAESLGIAAAKMSKDELKTAIKAAEGGAEFKFKDDVQAEMAALTQERLVGTLQSLDDYKYVADVLCVKYDALNKDELKAAIKVADTSGQYCFREDEFARIYAGKNLLSAEDAEKISTIQRNVLLHARAKEMLTSPGEAELSGFWSDLATGVECKFRIDKLVQLGNTPVAMLDVKTTRDASSDGFAKACATYGYDVQAAYYIDGAKAVLGLELPFYFLAVENEAPHAVALYRASPEMIEAGRKKVRAGLMLMQYCRSTGNWPSYQPNGEEEQISLPAWANRQADDYDMED